MGACGGSGKREGRHREGPEAESRRDPDGHHHAGDERNRSDTGDFAAETACGDPDFYDARIEEPGGNGARSRREGAGAEVSCGAGFAGCAGNADGRRNVFRPGRAKGRGTRKRNQRSRSAFLHRAAAGERVPPGDVKTRKVRSIPKRSWHAAHTTVGVCTPKRCAIQAAYLPVASELSSERRASVGPAK